MKHLRFTFLILGSLLAPALAVANTPISKPQIAFAERRAPCLTQTEISLPGEVLIMEETFEGSFPNGLWSIYCDGIDAYWDDVNCASAEGNWSAWCAIRHKVGCRTPGRLDLVHAGPTCIHVMRSSYDFIQTWANPNPVGHDHNIYSRQVLK